MNLTNGQIQHLRDRFGVVVADAPGGSTIDLRRRNDKPLKVATVEKMLGLKDSGFRQIGNWVEVDI